jgi:ribosomal protein S21
LIFNQEKVKIILYCQMIQIQRKLGEKPEALLRRFNRLIQEAGLSKIVRENRFNVKPPTRRERRETAQRKVMIRKLKNEALYQQMRIRI